VNVLFVASEMAPFAKTGGLADVMAALPAYLHRAGHEQAFAGRLRCGGVGQVEHTGLGAAAGGVQLIGQLLDGLRP